MAIKQRPNEPQRVIMRGKTRLIGNRSRPQEAAGTAAQRAEQSTPGRRIGNQVTRTNADTPRGESRVTAAPRVPRQPAEAPPEEGGAVRISTRGGPRSPARPAASTGSAEPAPRTMADERRPLDRIAELEANVAELDGQLSEVVVMFNDKVAELEAKAEAMAATIAHIADQLNILLAPATEPPPPELEGEATGEAPLTEPAPMRTEEIST